MPLDTHHASNMDQTNRTGQRKIDKINGIKQHILVYQKSIKIGVKIICKLLFLIFFKINYLFFMELEIAKLQPMALVRPKDQLLHSTPSR